MSLESRIASLGSLPHVLDAGGWWIPLAQATHVVDLFPYETRGAKVNLQPLAGERFRADTWFQIDFLAPGFRLPFADGFFDFAYCGHTIEDLANPEPLMSELQRVARAGVIRCPSRLSEQTLGVTDRMGREPGHPHHHWIVDQEANRLRLCAKKDSWPAGENLLPHTYYERTVKADPTAFETVYFWEGQIKYTIIRGNETKNIARKYFGDQKLRPGELARDHAIRALRRVKYWRSRKNAKDWWWPLVELSRPYSRIPLPRKEA